MIGLISVIFLSSHVMAANSFFAPRVHTVAISQSDASFGQVGMITISVFTGDCRANLKAEATIESVPSVNPNYLMEAIIIKVFPELTDCGATYIGRTTVLSEKTDQLIGSAISSIAPEKRDLPKILRLPEVAL
jgi:hypothetical protein